MNKKFPVKKLQNSPKLRQHITRRTFLSYTFSLVCLFFLGKSIFQRIYEYAEDLLIDFEIWLDENL